MDINVSPEDVQDWVDNDGPSHGFLTDNEIIDDIMKGRNVLENCDIGTRNTTDTDDNYDQKQPPKAQTTSISTILAWMNGAYAWFLQDADTTQEQVKQMAHLRVYVLTYYHSENGDQSIALFATVKDKNIEFRFLAFEKL